MKKILVLMFFAIITAGVSAQIDNNMCFFKFDSRGIYSAQDSNKDYIVYEVPTAKASDLKASVMSAISELYKSPKDVLTNLGDNIIQLETYASNVYSTKVKEDRYFNDISYSIIIQFKDGKVRYNAPNVKQIWITGVPLMGTLKLDMTKSLSTLIDTTADRNLVVAEFNKLIKAINNKIDTANDW